MYEPDRVRVLFDLTRVPQVPQLRFLVGLGAFAGELGQQQHMTVEIAGKLRQAAGVLTDLVIAVFKPLVFRRYELEIVDDDYTQRTVLQGDPPRPGFDLIYGKILVVEEEF